jgi:peptidoglycan/xylan/chitin deacetylase (PgdA/CDA1 family)
VLRKIAGLPLAFVILFDVTALIALAFAMTWLSKPADNVVAAEAAKHDGSKRIAISFDDAPRGPGAFLDQNIRPQMLLAALKRAGVRQAAFFTNPGRLGPIYGREASLRAYAKAGHVLANHTANHLVLSDVSAERFLGDIDGAEKWLKPEPGYRPWFRYPQLDEG